MVSGSADLSVPGGRPCVARRLLPLVAAGGHCSLGGKHRSGAVTRIRGRRPQPGETYTGKESKDRWTGVLGTPLSLLESLSWLQSSTCIRWVSELTSPWTLCALNPLPASGVQSTTHVPNHPGEVVAVSSAPLAAPGRPGLGAHTGPAFAGLSITEVPGSPGSAPIQTPHQSHTATPTPTAWLWRPWGPLP